MIRRNHPLNALRAFEASARHLSFVQAAEELHVTPAAISHQVKRLEEYLGIPLFQRLPRGLLLADAGHTLVSELREIFTQLDNVVDRVIDSDSRGALTISVAPVFAVKWLLPRLRKFDELHPDIDVRMSSSVRMVDFHRDRFDLAVRLGRGKYAGLGSMKLFDESVTPVCSPRLLEQSRRLEQPRDLASFVLLHDDSMTFDPAAPTWRTWLEAAGAAGVNPSRGPRFSQPDHAFQAAMDGAGVALGWRCLIADDVAAGRLMEPFDLALPLLSSFYVVHPPAYAARPKVAAFRDWLKQESAYTRP